MKIKLKQELSIPALTTVKVQKSFSSGKKYGSGFFETDAQAKTHGRDIILYAVKKQRGKITELVRGGCYLGVNKGKGRVSSVSTLCVNTYIH